MPKDSKSKKFHLDEVSYIDTEGRIHFNVPKKDYGTIKEDNRSIQRKITDNIAGSVKQQLSGKSKVSPYLAYPAAGIVAATMLNPVSTLVGGIKGLVGATAVNEAAKQTTGKSYAKNVAEKFDINEDVAEFTNPGAFVGALNKQAIKTLTKNIGKQYLSEIRPVFKNNNTVTKSISSNVQNQIGNKQVLSLPNKNTNAKVHLGNSVILPSSNEIIPLEQTTQAYRRTLLKRINNIFTRRYGYKPIELAKAKTQKDTEDAIKELMTQHNTFIRGVGDKQEYINETNDKLIKLGLEPTKENRLKYYATHYAPPTDAGRVGFSNIPESRNPKIGTIYTSNMMGVGKGYGRSRNYRGIESGGTFAVRRPLDFNSSNLEDWVTNNEFEFKGLGSSKGGSNFFRYDLPYYLRYGETLTKKYLDENPLNLSKEEYNKIIDSVKRYHFIDTAPDNQKVRQNFINNLFGNLGYKFRLPASAIGDNHFAVALANIEHDAQSYAQKLRYDAMNKMIEDNPVYDYSDLDSKLLQEMPKLDKKLKGYYYGRYKNIDKEIEKSKLILESAIKKAIRAAHIRKRNNINLYEYAKTLGIEPTQGRTIVFGDRYGRNVTRHRKRNPGQHFNFAGLIDSQGLDLVREIPWSELKDIQSTNGGHYGPWTEGYSRKVKRYGGEVNRRSLANGGKIYIKPSHRGRLTELKERTGKSEAELYNDGNPAHKKMVVFARNARKWNK
jgi:hypothetical protein